MKLLTKAIEAALPKLGATDGTPLEQKKVVAKFFTPDSNWTWFVFEGEREEGEMIFFGMVHGFEKEMGYFSLNELETVTGPLGLHIERDLHCEGKTYGEI